MHTTRVRVQGGNQILLDETWAHESEVTNVCLLLSQLGLCNTAYNEISLHVVLFCFLLLLETSASGRVHDSSRHSFRMTLRGSRLCASPPRTQSTAVNGYVFSCEVERRAHNFWKPDKDETWVDEIIVYNHMGLPNGWCPPPHIGCFPHSTPDFFKLNPIFENFRYGRPNGLLCHFLVFITLGAFKINVRWNSVFKVFWPPPSLPLDIWAKKCPRVINARPFCSVIKEILGHFDILGAASTRN